MTNVDSSKGKFLLQIHILQKTLSGALSEVTERWKAIQEVLLQVRFRRQLAAYLLTGLLCIFSWVGYAGVSVAAGVNDATATEAALTDTDVSAKQIDQFAKAYLQVLTLLSERESERPATEPQTETAEVQASLESETVAIIEKSGLTIPEYMQILGLASQDDALRDKVLSRMDAAIRDIDAAIQE